jgi:hypothetical protein
MYHRHFQLKAEPFGVSPDSRFFFQTEQHREALATLYYGISQRRGFALLTGRPGLGKTSVLVQLLQMLEGKEETAYLRSASVFHVPFRGTGASCNGCRKRCPGRPEIWFRPRHRICSVVIRRTPAQLDVQSDDSDLRTTGRDGVQKERVEPQCPVGGRQENRELGFLRSVGGNTAPLST